MESQRPKILGAMLDILVKAINLYPSIRTDTLYRMADYTIWGLAITKALGLESQHFIEAYEDNIAAQNLEAIRANPISDALIKLMESKPLGWSGTASQLYSELEEQAKALKISTQQKTWPKKPHVLSRVLNELAPSLPAVGLNVERGYREKARIIHITIVGSYGSVGEVEGQVDWGKGGDLRNYLGESTVASVASDGIVMNYSGNQTEQPAKSQTGTREKFDKLLELIDILGSANLDELEGLAEKKLGINHSDFGALISAMLKEGLIAPTEDEKGVRRARPKTQSTSENGEKGRGIEGGTPGGIGAIGDSVTAQNEGIAEGENKLTPPAQDKPDSDGYFHCPYCNFKCLTKKDLDAHIDWHQGGG